MQYTIPLLGSTNPQTASAVDSASAGTVVLRGSDGSVTAKSLNGTALDVSGGIAAAVRAVAAAGAILVTDFLVRLDATAGAFTAPLPAASTTPGGMIIAKRINAGSNNVTIGITGSDLIDGAATYVLTAQYSFVILISNGAGWDIVAHS